VIGLPAVLLAVQMGVTEPPLLLPA